MVGAVGIEPTTSPVWGEGHVAIDQGLSQRENRFPRIFHAGRISS